MRRLLLILALLLPLSCSHGEWPQPLSVVAVQVVYPDGYASSVHEGAKLRLVSVAGGESYLGLTDRRGSVVITVPQGLYRLSVSDRQGSDVFNGSMDKVLVQGPVCEFQMQLSYARAGSLVISELYVGGCSKAPKEGTYQSDQYVILHNNDSETFYLDSLCFGTLSPYNATAVNHWLQPGGSFPPFAPVVTAIWRFPGDGHTFPLAPGEDAVVALRGAIDHSAEYPQSVNLNRPDVFVCYNTVLFPNPLYHPAPGDKIRRDHILDVVVKTGQSNANTISISSPTFLIFKAEGMPMEEFVNLPDIVQPTPGNSADVVVKLPWEWVLDAVEVFDGSRSGNAKRLPDSIDAGFVVQSETFKGRSLQRREDKAESERCGYTVLQDTNNSTNDFYERSTQSLRP